MAKTKPDATISIWMNHSLQEINNRRREEPCASALKSKKGSSATKGKKATALYFSQKAAPNRRPTAKWRATLNSETFTLSTGRSAATIEESVCAPMGGKWTVPCKRNQTANTKSIRKASGWTAWM